MDSFFKSYPRLKKQDVLPAYRSREGPNLAGTSLEEISWNKLYPALQAPLPDPFDLVTLDLNSSVLYRPAGTAEGLKLPRDPAQPF